MGLHQVKPNPPLLKASYFQCTNAQVTILPLQLMKCDILDDFLWNMSKTTTRADWTALIISLRSIVATDCLWRSAQSRGNESQIENRNVFFLSPPPPPALFIQLLCRRGHKFCSRAICFSKAQYKCHTQGSEVQTLVCLMHNLYWSTPSFVLSSWPHPQAHCLYQIIYPVQVISKRFSAVHYKYLAKACTQHDYIHALLFLMLSKPQFNWE